MRLRVVGAGPAYSTDPEAVGACYLVEAGPAALALDLGHGAFSRLASVVAPERLASIVVSHLHADHFVDLVPLRHYLRYGLRPPGAVRVDAPADLPQRLEGLTGEPGFGSGILDVHALVPGRRRIGAFELEIRSVHHTPESVAVRVTAGTGPGLVYSGDVGRAEDLIPLVRAGDTVLVEASFGVGPVPPDAAHLDAPAVAGLAARTAPGRVILTHVLDPIDRDAIVAVARRGHSTPVELARPDDRFDI